MYFILLVARWKRDQHIHLTIQRLCVEIRALAFQYGVHVFSAIPVWVFFWYFCFYSHFKKMHGRFINTLNCP